MFQQEMYIFMKQVEKLSTTTVGNAWELPNLIAFKKDSASSVNIKHIRPKLPTFLMSLCVCGA